MRDGIEMARRQIPAISLVTEDFWPQGDFVARSVGMSTAPRVRLPHPVAGSGEARMTELVKELVPTIAARFRGDVPGDRSAASSAERLEEAGA